MQKIWKEHKIYLLCISFIAIFVMAFLSMGEEKNAHDISFHVSNIETLSQYIDPLHFRFTAPSIMPHTGNQLGYGLYIFYPSMPHLIYAYFSKFFSLFSIDTLHSIYIVNILFTIITSFLLYFLSYRLAHNKKVAFLSSVLYIVFPYRLSNIFIRFAINETFSLLFILLLFMSLLDLKELQYKRFFWLFTVSIVGLIYTHLATTFYLFFLCILPYFFIYRKHLTRKIYFLFLKSFLCIVIMVFPFLLNLLLHMPLDYVFSIPNYMTSLSLLKENALSLSSLFSISSDYWQIISYISPILLCFCLLSIGFIFYEKNRFYFYLCIISFFCFYIMSPYFPWERMPSFLYFIQFPWRLEIVLCITIPLLTPYFLKHMEVLFYPFLLFLLFITYPLVQRINDTPYLLEDGVVLRTYETGNLGEYYPYEYLNNQSYFEERKQNLVLLDGDISYEILESDFPNFTFSVTHVDDAYVEFPRLYYLGYELTNGREKIYVERGTNGLLCANIQKNGIYTLRYKKPFLVRLALYLKYGLLCILFCIRRKIR